MENKWNDITPTFTHLSTLQKLKDPYIGTFLNESWDDSSKQLISFLFILLELKFEQDSQSNKSQEHWRFSHSGSANNRPCELFAEQQSRRLILCSDRGLENNVYNLNGESRRSRLGSCFTIPWTWHFITLIEPLGFRWFVLSYAHRLK